jgi:hypothetical protein
LKHRFTDLAKFAFFVCQKPDNPVASCVETMKYSLIVFNKVVICGGQKAGNEFLGLLNHLKYRFINFTKDAFCDNNNADIVF